MLEFSKKAFIFNTFLFLVISLFSQDHTQNIDLPSTNNKKIYAGVEIGPSVLYGDFKRESGFDNIWKPGIGCSLLLGYNLYGNFSYEGRFSFYTHLPYETKNYDFARSPSLTISGKHNTTIDKVNFYSAIGGGVKYFLWFYNNEKNNPPTEKSAEINPVSSDSTEVEDDGLIGYTLTFSSGVKYFLSENFSLNANSVFNVNLWSDELLISNHKIKKFEGNNLEFSFGGKFHF